VETLLMESLLNSGYDINYVINPMPGGNGEYYIYLVLDGKRHVVFSNLKAHEKEGAVVAKAVDDSNVNDIIKNILAKL
jgi:hypothetical protein